MFFSGQPPATTLLLDPAQRHPLNSRDLLNRSLAMENVTIIMGNVTASSNDTAAAVDLRGHVMSFLTSTQRTAVMGGSLDGSVIYPWLIAITVLLIIALLIALVHFILYLRRRSSHGRYSPRQVPEFLSADPATKARNTFTISTNKNHITMSFSME